MMFVIFRKYCKMINIIKNSEISSYYLTSQYFLSDAEQ